MNIRKRLRRRLQSGTYWWPSQLKGAIYNLGCEVSGFDSEGYYHSFRIRPDGSRVYR